MEISQQQPQASLFFIENHFLQLRFWGRSEEQGSSDSRKKFNEKYFRYFFFIFNLLTAHSKLKILFLVSIKEVVDIIFLISSERS